MDGRIIAYKHTRSLAHGLESKINTLKGEVGLFFLNLCLRLWKLTRNVTVHYITAKILGQYMQSIV